MQENNLRYNAWPQKEETKAIKKIEPNQNEPQINHTQRRY